MYMSNLLVLNNKLYDFNIDLILHILYTLYLLKNLGTVVKINTVVEVLTTNSISIQVIVTSYSTIHYTYLSIF